MIAEAILSQDQATELVQDSKLAQYLHTFAGPKI